MLFLSFLVSCKYFIQLLGARSALCPDDHGCHWCGYPDSSLLHWLHAW
jgi:hypothetical protein